MNLAVELLNYVVLVIVALIPIANPFSTAPLFIGMTAGLSQDETAKVARLASLYMFIILTVFLLLGAAILAFFGISLSALRIAGGLIIATIGFRMLFESKPKEEEPYITSESVNKIAFTPLAMPMLSGPGAIAVIMSMAVSVSQLETVADKFIAYGVITMGIAISAVICWLVLRASGSVTRFMGESGIDALTKIMGFLLVSIGVQFVIGAVQTLIG